MTQLSFGCLQLTSLISLEYGQPSTNEILLTDVNRIIDAGVTRTPALTVNGDVKSSHQIFTGFRNGCGKVRARR